MESNFAPITEKEKDRLVQALKKVKAMNEVDRAKVVGFALGPRGREFKSPHSDQIKSAVKTGESNLYGTFAFSISTPVCALIHVESRRLPLFW